MNEPTLVCHKCKQYFKGNEALFTIKRHWLFFWKKLINGVHCPYCKTLVREIPND